MNRSLLRPAGMLIVAALIAFVAAHPAEAGHHHRARRCCAPKRCHHSHSRCHKHTHNNCCTPSCCTQSCCVTVGYAAPSCSSCQGGVIVAPEAAPADMAPAPTDAAPDAPAPPEAVEDAPAPEPYAPEPAEAAPAEAAPAEAAPAEEAAPPAPPEAAK